MKRILSLVLAVILLAGCTVTNPPETYETTETIRNPEKKLVVVSSLFPQYDFVRIIGGDKVESKLLLPPGVEAHSFEPTPKDIELLSKADLFFYTGENMEPWVHKLVKENVKGVVAVDLSQGIEMIEGHHHEEEGHETETGESHEGEEHHEEGELDPHIWTDPVNAKDMALHVLHSLSVTSPAHKEYFQKNADALIKELEGLDKSLSELVKGTDTPSVIFGGHQVFGYLSKRYGIQFITAYEGLSPDQEPSSRAMAELVDVMKARTKKVIYYEEIIEPKIAKLISNETGAELVLLHGLHNVTKEDLEKGVGYVDLMKQNIENLKKGME
ncbi:metal ABC transporter substrate-binding protein [Guggenheimella bovis]